ncbi:unnamed protein product [Symbiodinium sp. CCMP2592]|nr:unnamed protein product [Symbiodinium sp. CCMP2592]
MGLDEELRQEAEHSNYGAYQQRQTIVQSGNNFEIANELKARVVSVFSVGGGVQPSRDLHGRQASVWECVATERGLTRE